MTPVNLHGFREIARTNTSRALVETDSTKVQKGKTKFLEKIVAWFKGGYSGQTKIDNQRTLTAFKNALKHSYGDTIGDRAFGSLSNDFKSGKPLPARKIKEAIKRADALKTLQQTQNRLIAQVRCHSKLDEFFQVAMGKSKEEVLSGRDQARLIILVNKNARELANTTKGTLTGPQVDQVIRDSIQEFYDLDEATFAKRFPILSTMADVEKGETLNLKRVLDSSILKVASTNKDMAFAMESAVMVLTDTLDLLMGQCPISKEEIQEFRTAVTNQKQVLQDLKAKITGDGPETEMRKALCDEIDGQIRRLDEKLAHVEGIGESVPTSQVAVAKARKLWVDSAVKLLNGQIETARREARGEDPPGPATAKLNALTELRDTLVREIRGELESAQPGESFSKEEMETKVKNFPKALTERIKSTFKQHGISTGDVKEKLSALHLKELNEGQEWTTVSRELHFTNKGRPFKFGSEIRPGAQLGNVFDDMGGKGVSCASFSEDQHTVNLCQSTLRDESGKVIFSGLRHGVHSAFGISDPVERAMANGNRAKESLKGALLMKPDLLTRALNGEVVDLDISSISLLTPDNARALLKSKHSNEKDQLMDQLGVWKFLSDPSNHPIELDMKDPEGRTVTVKIKPDVLAFNFGLNVGAMKGIGPLSNKLDLVGGWGNVREANSEAMEKLLGDTTPGAPLEGRVGKWLQENPDHPNAKHVRKLSEQIRSIWVDDAFMTQGHEHTKIVSRLAVLTHMMDDVPMWNCKSGKDRTGLMDVEAKFLSALIAINGDVPEPDHELTEEEKTMWREFAVSSGNLEIQQMNTGLGGFKTEGVEVINERIGGKDSSGREYYRGGSHFVKE